MPKYTGHLLESLEALFPNITSPLLAVLRYQRDQENSCKSNRNGLGFRLFDIFLRTWHLGITAFGGPPVHYTIIHRRFVEGQDGYAPWMDERSVNSAACLINAHYVSLIGIQYQDVFALSQALPGPASTKMLFVMVYLRAGLTPAIMSFFLWRSGFVL
jgi:hypothetical protein